MKNYLVDNSFKMVLSQSKLKLNIKTVELGEICWREVIKMNSVAPLV